MAPDLRLSCPACGREREATRVRGVVCWPCSACRTVVMNASVLRRFVGESTARLLWRAVLASGAERPSHPCPTCARSMSSLSVSSSAGTAHAAACRSCRLVAFDARELDAAAVPAPPETVELTPEQARALAKRAIARAAAHPGPLPALFTHFRTDRSDRADHAGVVVEALLDVPWLLLAFS